VSFSKLLDYNIALIIFKINVHSIIFLITYFPRFTFYQIKLHYYVLTHDQFNNLIRQIN